MEYVIVFALGMLAATLLIRWMARRAIDQFVERFADAVEEKIEDNQLRVNVEFDQDIYFLYNSDDGSFVAQGTNLQELKQHLQQRFPNQSVNVVNGDKDILKRLSSEIEDFNQTKTTT